MDSNAQHVTQFADLAWNWAALFLPRLAAAAAIIIAGLAAISCLDRALRGVLGPVHHVDSTLKPILISVVRYAVLVLVAIVDSTLKPILISMVRYAVLVLVAIAALSQIGIQTTSLLALIGAAGLATYAASRVVRLSQLNLGGPRRFADECAAMTVARCNE
jgi:small conductance mechanosensitive channel